MIYEEKLSIVLRALFEARKFTREKQLTKLYVTLENGLRKLNTGEIHDILLKLQDDEKIIRIANKPTKLKSLGEKSEDLLEGDRDYFLIEDLSNLDVWYSNFLLEEKRRLENLSNTNFNNLNLILTRIENELELSDTETVTISLEPENGSDGWEIEDVHSWQQYQAINLKYLKKLDVLKEFTSQELQLFSEITINTTKFFEIQARAKTEAEKRKQQNTKPSLIPEKEHEETEKVGAKSSDAIYEITYAENRAILLNKHIQLAKPDFNSENDLVFGFLYKNPNKKHSRIDIEDAISNKLSKTLHKIVENLGFKGNLKTAFMDVTKDTICFRNPITQDDLEKLGISKIKLPK